VIVTWQIHAIFLCGLFAIGTVVGSFLNVCIYRIPYEKSVIWPASHCPKCWSAIAPQDNVPILSWLALRGECRTCGLRIAIRYPLIEALVGLLFAAVYVTDVIHGPPIPWSGIPTAIPMAVVYHLVLVSLLVTATFIDYDFTIIPDAITVTGAIVGIGLGTFFPEIRPAPGLSTSHWEGFKVGMIGLLVGGGLTQVIRVGGTIALRRGEAMGIGDVTLMAMIGSFLGWQAAVLTFFIGPFFGLAHSLWKLVVLIGKKWGNRKSSRADHEIPFGPYLSMAALTMLLSWPWFWPGWGQARFAELRDVAGFLVSMTPLSRLFGEIPH
jgi:leader peptidase (prepilin peptidase) / N-methyltransferase